MFTYEDDQEDMNWKSLYTHIYTIIFM